MISSYPLETSLAVLVLSITSLPLTSFIDHGMRLSIWNLLLPQQRSLASGMKYPISIAELQNYTVNVEGCSLHLMLQQRVPGKFNTSYNYEHCRSLCSKYNMMKSVPWRRNLQKKLLKCMMRLAQFWKKMGKNKWLLICIVLLLLCT